MLRHGDIRTVDPVETYMIVRRGGWRTTDEVRGAQLRSSVEGEAMAEGVRWIRSYVLAETDGSLGMVCVYQATSPEAVRRHSYAASLPVDEIVAVAETVVVQPDPLSVTA
jgi:Protein of unknown function (DUF4242)